MGAASRARGRARAKAKAFSRAAKATARASVLARATHQKGDRELDAAVSVLELVNAEDVPCLACQTRGTHAWRGGVRVSVRACAEGV